MDKRLDVWIDEELKDYIATTAKKENKSMNQIISDLIKDDIARKQGSIIEQQSLPIVREIVSTELRQQLAQQRLDLREDMQLEFTNEFKSVTRASDNRLAALIVRTLRDSSIVRRLSFTILSRSFGPDFASKAYDDAKEKAGQELASRKTREDDN